jgi:gamma-glutamyltranspeptidase/glutathione hydrolase
MQNFNWSAATPSISIQPGAFVGYESDQTTHYSIVDKDGNAVSITTTLNDTFGSKIFVKGAGFLLNNEMDDFSSKPGTPNMYGMLGGKANSIQPGKRMLSSMTPTIVEKDGKLFMVVGTPGGATIITSVFQTVLNVIEFDKSMQGAVSAKRFHHQWMPDEVDI